MKKASCTALAAALLLVLTLARTGRADETYHPYHYYEEYYRQHTAPEPAKEAPTQLPQPEKQVKPPLRPEQPITLTQAPEFLFPEQLGFGVAVGTPYDLFYLSDSYYLLKNGTWYRADWYRGPWKMLGLSRVPPALRKYELARIREIRNREFATFWKDRQGYRGRYFRPDEAPAAPPPKGKASGLN